MNSQKNRFEGKVAVITGGGGVLCSAIAKALAKEGASIAILDIRGDAAETVASKIRAEGGKALAIQTDVTDRTSVEKACKEALREFETVDILVNGAGGNDPRATTSPKLSFFDIPQEALERVVRLNLLGTRIPAYSAAKAAVSNFTQWLAVHMSQNYSKKIRVNAVAPGFFVTKQTRFLLVQENGTPTPRGKAVIEHTPMSRLGEPKDLLGIVLFLLSDEAAFIHGVIIPVDGGFSAYSGV